MTEPLPNHELEVFYDGGCPLCRREVQWLARRDRQRRIRFTDIDAANFSAVAVGKTQAELMAQLHARLPDGTWLAGVEVFRRMYAAVGFAPLVWLSRAPGVAQLLQLGYAWFARRRLGLTGRCAAGECRVPPAG